MVGFPIRPLPFYQNILYCISLLSALNLLLIMETLYLRAELNKFDFQWEKNELNTPSESLIYATVSYHH